jgi:lipopolysaccharide transport system permease protein
MLGESILRAFVVRDIASRYLVSFSGGLWALLHPAILLIIYAFVFVEIFKARIAGSGIEFVPFFATALWPWTAFVESLTRATNAIPENAALLSKVNIPRYILVVAPIAATFLVNAFGIVVVSILLKLFGYSIFLSHLALIILPLFALLILTIGVALIVSSMTVFIRDLSQLVPQVLSMLFFLSPIMYSASMVPDKFKLVMQLNPVVPWIESIRALLLNQALPSTSSLSFAAVATLLIFAVGVWVFNKLSPSFEDFL